MSRMQPCPYCATENPEDALLCRVCGSSLVSVYLPVGYCLQEGRYCIRDVLGEGGFGITYRGFDQVLQRNVAIKELFPDGSSRRQQQLLLPPNFDAAKFREARENFLKEARILARFNHVGIADVWDMFEANATAYMVMEFLQGQTLLQRIEAQGQLPVAEVIQLALELTPTLEKIHEVGLLHRDIKPDNIILTDEGRAVLIDFGSADAYIPGQRVALERLVTPGYAAPEQYLEEAHFAPYTDVYGLAATLYHALSGQAPPAVPERIREDTLAPLPSEVPMALQHSLRRGLAMNTAMRPRSVQDFAAALEPVLTRSSYGQDVASANASADTAASHEATRSAPAQSVPLRPPSSPAPPPLPPSKPLRWSRIRNEAFIAHDSAVKSLCFSPDSQQLISASEDSVIVWDAEHGDVLERYSLPANTELVSRLGFANDGALLLCLAYQGHVLVYDVYRAEARWQFKDHREASYPKLHHHYSCLSSDGSMLLSGGYALRLWDIASGRIIGGFTNRTEEYGAALCFSYDNRYVAAGNRQGDVVIWDVQHRVRRRILHGSSQVFDLCFSPDGSVLAAAGFDKVLRLWDVEHGKLLQTLEGHRRAVFALRFSPDGSLLVSGGGAALNPFGNDNDLRLWRVSSSQMRALRGHSDVVNALCFSPDGSAIASASDDHSVRLWRAVE